MMDRLYKTTTEYGMKTNTKKTKAMKISRVEGEEKNMEITIDGEDIEQITEIILLLGKPDINHHHYHHHHHHHHHHIFVYS